MFYPFHHSLFIMTFVTNFKNTLGGVVGSWFNTPFGSGNAVVPTENIYKAVIPQFLYTQLSFRAF